MKRTTIVRPDEADAQLRYEARRRGHVDDRVRAGGIAAYLAELAGEGRRVFDLGEVCPGSGTNLGDGCPGNGTNLGEGDPDSGTNLDPTSPDAIDDVRSR